MTLNSELMALLVHDLKNPLAALVSNLGFIATTVSGDEETSEAVQDCLLSTEVLTRLVENLGAMGSLEVHSELLGDSLVQDVFSSVETRMRRHAEASMIQLSASCEPDVNQVAGNSKLLELALDNIISTSMAYAPTNSTIQLSARRIDAQTVAISVIDDGPPVKDDFKNLVTKKDAQIEIKSAKGGRYGRGFGLYVSALVAQHVGGELLIGESEGRSVFELRLKST